MGETVLSEFLAKHVSELPFQYVEFRERGGPRQAGRGGVYIWGFVPRVLCDTLAASGIERKLSMKENCVLVLGDQVDVEQLEPGQRANHFANSGSFATKDGFQRLVMSSEGWEDFYPESCILPDQREQLVEVFRRYPQWIRKPLHSSHASGMKVLTELPRSTTKPMLVQRFLNSPLLCDGKHFVIRQCVLLASVEPLRVYLAGDGIVSLSDAEIINHVTSTKWALSQLWSKLAERGVPLTVLKRRLREVIAQLFVGVQGPLLGQANRHQCFEVYGVDIMVDSDLKPYVLELQVKPAMGVASEVDAAVKVPFMRDMLNAVPVPRCTVFSRTVDRLLLSEGEDVDALRSLVGIVEHELAGSRQGSLELIVPGFAAGVTPADAALGAWLAGDDEVKRQFLEVGLEAYLRLTVPQPEGTNCA